MSNKYPQIEIPTEDAKSQMNTILQLKEVVELLTGVRKGADPAVTWDDLNNLGVAQPNHQPVTSKSNWDTLVDEEFTSVDVREYGGLNQYRWLNIIGSLQPDTVADAFQMNWAAADGIYDTNAWGQYLMYNTSSSSTPTGSSTAGTRAYYDMNYQNLMATPAILDYPYMFEIHVKDFNRARQHKSLIQWFSGFNSSSQVFQGTDYAYNNARMICDRIKIKNVSGGKFSGHLFIQGKKG